MIRHAGPLLAYGCALALCSRAPADIVLRGGRVLDDRVVGIGPQGVESEPRLSPGTTRTIPWDMVREVDEAYAEQTAPFAADAQRAWRARARLERGDIDLAEPLLADLFSRHRGGDGPFTLRIALGLLRCRCARADQGGAVEAWLDALAQQGRDAGIPVSPADPAPYSELIDAETGLCPALPPVWANRDAALAFVGGGARVGDAWSDPVRELARLYARAAALDAGAPVNPEPRIDIAPDSSEPGAKGIALVRAIVRSREPDASARLSARERLLSGLAGDADTWKEAWRRAALGRSLLMESDAAARAEGLVHLLHVRARFSESQPLLAGLAVVEAATELSRRGGDDAKAGTRLLNELKASEPLHPALVGIVTRGATP